MIINISDNFENKLLEKEKILKETKENQDNLNLEEEIDKLKKYLIEINKIGKEIYGK